MSGAHHDPSIALSRRERRVGRVHGPRRFRSLQRARTRARSGPIKVTWVPGDAVCVAYAIPKTVGNAVQRNLVRRRLRAAFAAHRAAVPAGDMLVRVVTTAEECTWPALSQAVADTLDRIGRSARALS